MKLRVRAADLTTYEPIVLLNAEDCLVMGVGPTDRVRIEGRNPAVATVTIADFPDIRGCISMPTNLLERCRVSKGDYVDVSYSPLPGSIRSVIEEKVAEYLYSLPEDASDKTIIWTTSDESIITVDNGVISAHSEGAATIIAKTSNGLIDVCTITVNAPKDTDSDTSSDNKTNTDTTDTADTPGIPETKDTPSKPDNPETPDTPDKPVKEIMLGDVDGDGKVTAKDSMAIQRYTVNLTKFDDNQLLAADTNGDHKVTSKDAMNILRYTVKLNTKYPIGENV